MAFLFVNGGFVQTVDAESEVLSRAGVTGWLLSDCHTGDRPGSAPPVHAGLLHEL